MTKSMHQISADEFIEYYPDVAIRVAREVVRRGLLDDPVSKKPKVGLTKRQLDTLKFITAYIESHGYSPSVEDVRAGLGLASRSAAHRAITHLVERGRITREPNAFRSISIVRDK